MYRDKTSFASYLKLEFNPFFAANTIETWPEGFSTGDGRFIMNSRMIDEIFSSNNCIIRVKSFNFWDFKNLTENWAIFHIFSMWMIILSPYNCRVRFQNWSVLIILSFYSLLATFQVYVSLIFHLFLNSLLWMKQMQGSVRVNFNEYVDA